MTGVQTCALPIYAKVYESPEYAAEVEQEHMLERNKIADDAPDAEEA